jgi:hypothetical protein
VTGVERDDCAADERGRAAERGRRSRAPGNTGSPEHDRPLVDFIAARAGYFEVMRTLSPVRTHIQ